MCDTVVHRLVIDLDTDDLSEKAVLEAGIKELKARLENAKTTEINDAAAKEIYSIYKSHQDAGFSPEQAFDILMAQIENSSRQRF